ncbi:MAG: XrtA/PEP-CTERM system histidine kinase PrsK [bacterium]
MSCLFTFGLALFVLHQGHDRLQNKAFALAATSVSIMEFGNFMALNSSHPGGLLFWARISLVGCCLIPPNWSLFSLVFAKASYETIPKKHKFFLAAVYIVAFCFLIFVPSNRFISLPDFQSSRYDFVLLRVAGRLFTLFLLVTIAFILVNLEAIYRNSQGAQRWQIKYSIIAIFAAFSYFIYIISRALLFRLMYVSYLPVGSSVILFCSGLLAYSFIRHRLMHIDIFISRQVFYGSFTLLTISLYLIMVGFIGELVKILGLGFNQLFYPVFVLSSLMALAAICLSKKNWTVLKRYIDRHFYKNKYDYRFEWIELTNRISSVVEIKELLARSIDLIAETMCVSEVSIWLFDDEDKKFHLSASRYLHLPESEMFVSLDHPLIGYLKEKAGPFSLVPKTEDHKAEELYHAHRKFFNRYKICTVTPLMVKDDLIGFMTLGEEVTGAVYNYEDFDILKTMCHQVANGILKIKLAERLGLAREMELMNRVSSFVLHDLKNYVSMLSLIVQNAAQNMDNPEFQRDVLLTISKTIENMKEFMAKMSSLPREILLNKIPCNLSELSKDTIEKIKSCKNGITIIENYGKLPMVNLDPEKIQSVIRNLIINAQESIPDGGIVSVSTFTQNGDIVIEVKDNGPGIPREFLKEKLFKPFQTTKKRGLGIGLYQCKAIVAAHQGKIEVESEEGSGALFRIYLPAKK